MTEQEGVALKARLLPAWTKTVGEGLRANPVSVGTAPFVMLMMASPVCCTPLRSPVAKRISCPAVFPAVNVAVGRKLAVRLPRDEFCRLHE